MRSDRTDGIAGGERWGEDSQMDGESGGLSWTEVEKYTPLVGDMFE